MAANSVRRRQFTPLLKAYSVALVKTPATIRKRWRIQRQRKVSAEYIDAILYHDLPPVHDGTLYQLFGRKKMGHKSSPICPHQGG